MIITVLPDQLQIETSSPIQLFDYRVYDSFPRSKINLTKNTFSFLLEGTKEVVGDYQSTTIDNNQFLIIKSGNCLMTETISTDNKLYKSILLFFTDEMLLDFLEKSKIDITTKDKTNQPFLICQYDTYIQHFVQSLEDIYKLNKVLQRTLLKIKFEEIMVYLIEKEGTAFLNALLENRTKETKEFVKVIEHNKFNKLSLQELAFLCNMSVSTFKRTFKKQYQMTPIKWFQEQRLEHAAFLLSTQKKTSYRIV